VAGAALLALTACSGSGSPASSGNVATIGATQFPTGTATNDVDAITWSGDSRPPLSLDPLKVADYPEGTATPNICESLVRLAPDYSLSSGLAESCAFDGEYLLRCSDPKLSAEDIALGYKQLLEVERGWRDMKTTLDLRPVFHRREDRIRAHILLCWLALLLIRVAETETGRTWTTSRTNIDRLHLACSPAPPAPSPNAPNCPNPGTQVWPA
jgi:hypothetical protein